MNWLVRTRPVFVSWLVLAGACASPTYDWLPPPEKTALMVVHAHPDDEGKFFGGAVADYAEVQNLLVVLISMTSGDWKAQNGPPDWRREEELRCAAWIYGLRYEPVFLRFKDAPTHQEGNHGGYANSIDATWDWWNDGELDGFGSPGQDAAAGRQKAIDTLATLIRTFKPDVVITHDLQGEYGHDNHKATAVAVTEAYTRAAAPAYVDGLDPWQVLKLYVHLYPTNKLFHVGWEKPSAALGGLTPRQAADAGLRCHVSQWKPDVSTFYRSGENHDGYDSEWWGLYATTVGPDSVGPSGYATNGFFEHVDLSPHTENQPPVVDEGPDSWGEAPWVFGLDGTAGDNGLPTGIAWSTR